MNELNYLTSKNKKHVSLGRKVRENLNITRFSTIKTVFNDHSLPLADTKHRQIFQWMKSSDTSIHNYNNWDCNTCKHYCDYEEDDDLEARLQQEEMIKDSSIYSNIEPEDESLFNIKKDLNKINFSKYDS